MSLARQSIIPLSQVWIDSKGCYDVVVLFTSVDRSQKQDGNGQTEESR